MTRGAGFGFLLLCSLLAASASPEAVLREQGEEAVSSWQEACEDPSSLVFLCGEEVCAFYRCQEVIPGQVVRTFSGAPMSRPAMPVPGGSAMRYWGSAQGLPGNAQPVFIIPWYNDKPQPLLPEVCEQQRKEAERLARRPRVKHHIFAQEFKAWFKFKGIEVHEWTLVLFKDDHDRIHLGASGGPWNAEWRQYIQAHNLATKEDIWRQASEMIYRFELFGPVIPYYRRKLPDLLCTPPPRP